MPICETCLHAAVCAKRAAVGDNVKNCKHYAEARRGRWERVVELDTCWYECSECGIGTPKHKSGADYFSDYCPNCGAYMDGVYE